MEQAISVLKEQRSVEVRALGSVLPDGIMCIMVNVTEESPFGENTAFFACFSYPCPDPLTNRIDALGLSHRRAPVAIGDDIQHWNRMLTVRHLPLSSILSLIALSQYGGVYPNIGVFVSLVTRIGIPIVSDLLI